MHSPCMTPRIEAQRHFWNTWNAQTREHERQQVSIRQAEVVIGWLEKLGRKDLRILEVGCGAGWFCPELARFGEVIGTDLSDEVLERAKQRWPHIDFIAGDFFALDFAPASFDVIVTLEVLSHVEDQQKFFARLAHLLVPGGKLFLATQNRQVLENHCNIPPPGPGQIRYWVDSKELSALASRHFSVDELFSVTPIAHRGWRHLLTARKVNALLSPVVGTRLRDRLEAAGWGWTLMLAATRQASVPF